MDENSGSEYADKDRTFLQPNDDRLATSDRIPSIQDRDRDKFEAGSLTKASFMENGIAAFNEGRTRNHIPILKESVQCTEDWYDRRREYFFNDMPNELLLIPESVMTRWTKEQGFRIKPEPARTRNVEEKGAGEVQLEDNEDIGTTSSTPKNLKA
ncbi:hypothetical protein CC78DRAFT_573528 [Lojkania enalia]|uniref:Uncharacterized protein n=1 Tax=Lojkania enalia TaxID=147567 RepID=A0A9P4ND90_9PLEO|nr:hypothetical protein CC78DRAFT_573528 [Didymosphaeria enalia]